MTIEHVALWVNDLEKSRAFFEKYFSMSSNDKYTNRKKQFNSYFLSFSGTSSPRIELMEKPQISANAMIRGMVYGYAHIAISVGSKEKVDALTEELRKDGYAIISEPRMTGDGYYESIVEDTEKNWIEITE